MLPSDLIMNKRAASYTDESRALRKLCDKEVVAGSHSNSLTNLVSDFPPLEHAAGSFCLSSWNQDMSAYLHLTKLFPLAPVCVMAPAC